MIVQSASCENGRPKHTGAAELESAKLKALAEFAAGAGHEINNPLATISGHVQLLLSDERDPQRRHALSTIGGQAYRIRDMIGDVMLFGRPPEAEPRQLNLTDVVRSVLDNLAESAEARNCRFELRCHSNSVVWADKIQLSVVVSSLIQNSLDALAETGGSITVETKTVVRQGTKHGCLAVSDDGPGLSEEQRAHLFDPFYSGRQAGRGLGFGLSKCWRIVLNHRGHIEVESNPGDRTEFRVYWPAEFNR